MATDIISKLRRRIIDVAYRDGMGHIPSALSILEIIWDLYDKVMGKDDQFVLSKGHGCMALYAVLEEKGHDVLVVDLSGRDKTASLSLVRDAVSQLPDAFGISATTPQFPYAVEILGWLRELAPNARVVS